MAKDARREVIEKRIVEVDSIIPSPNRIAAFIHGVLKREIPNITSWDLIAGCSEIVAALSIAEPALEAEAKALVKKVYAVHYFHGKDLKSCITSNLTSPVESASTKEQPLELMGNIPPQL